MCFSEHLRHDISESVFILDRQRLRFSGASRGAKLRLRPSFAKVALIQRDVNEEHHSSLETQCSTTAYIDSK